MRDLLRQNNLDLRREMACLRRVLQRARGRIPPELDLYYLWTLQACDSFHHQVTRNLSDLELNQDDLLPDLLSNTQTVTRGFHLFNQRWVSPVLRSSASDRLCLKLLRWLHATNPGTQPIPMALSDEEFGVWPVEPAIYFMPCSAQHGLLYLPLFFHEFGHLLYRCHGREMDALTHAFQQAIAEGLERHGSRGDREARIEEPKQRLIVETWYPWIQEIFCDTVGFVLGGPAFLDACSLYLRLRGQGEYHLAEQQLANRPHPVTWLRIRLLADRVRRMGYRSYADRFEGDWEVLAAASGTAEDYYGYYDDRFRVDIQRTVDDMLTETAPRKFTDQEIAATEDASSSPILLLNSAGRQFWKDPQSYRTWEERAIRRFLEQEEWPTGS